MPGILVDTVTAQPLQTVTVERAGTPELFRRFVRADGHRCSAGDLALGVCRVRSTRAEEIVPVDTDGIVLVEAGAALTLQAGLAGVKPDADGRAIPVGDLDPDPPAGIALAAARAAGAVVPVLLARERAQRVLAVSHADTNEVFQRYVRADGQRCVAGDQPIGVGRTASTTTGDRITVQVDGLAWVVAGAAIALSEGTQKVMPDAEGRAVTHTGEVAAGGLALTAAGAAGDLVTVLLNRA